MITSDHQTETRAEALYAAARAHLAGGVSAAARVHPSIGRPFMTARGQARAFGMLTGANTWT